MVKILILTTNRADYYKLEPIINIIHNNENINMYLVVAGSHLLTDYGNTYLNIDYPIYKKVNTLINVEDNKFMSESVSFGLMKYTSILDDINPDYVILHGDRFDILSMVNACLLMNIDIIHIEGGEISGGVDNKIRNMTSIVAKYHIVSNIQAYNNLLKIVDNKNNIYNLGCPIIDKYNSIDYNNINLFEDIIKELNLPIIQNDYLIVSFHIDTIDYIKSKKDFINLFNIIKKINKKTILFYPNIDNSDKEIIRYIDKNITNNIIVFKNIIFDKFTILLKNCSIFIGNSSAIVRESPYLGIQSILIGMRQKDRIISKNTYWLKNMDINVLESKIFELYNKKYTPDYLYGDGLFYEKFKDFINKLISN